MKRDRFDTGATGVLFKTTTRGRSTCFLFLIYEMPSCGCEMKETPEDLRVKPTNTLLYEGGSSAVVKAVVEEVLKSKSTGSKH